jgi:pyruvate dehydrogenase E1 component alpha subunit
MPIETIYEAKTERLQILNSDGNVDEELLPDLSDDQVRKLYKDMVLMRLVDEKALKLQRQGRMGTWAPSRGQEAAQAGAALALKEDDWLVPAFREAGLLFMLGVPIHEVFSYWAGDSRGAFNPKFPHILPPAVPVGSQLVHAAGIGMALKLKREKKAVLTYGGDGATSEGDFHEALNFAGVFKAQTVFLIQNNQFAISVRFKNQTAVSNIAQKAHAYGMPGIQVDGNDVFAVYVAVSRALERARNGEGPSLIETLTYRLGDHTTADDASRYRTEEEVELWEKRSPITRLQTYMTCKGIWDDKQEETLLAEVNELIEEEVRIREQSPPLEPTEIFKYMYREMPWNLKEQMEMLAEEVGS